MKPQRVCLIVLMCVSGLLLAACDTPTPVPPTPTVAPTATPLPSPTVEPTATPSPSPTSTPTTAPTRVPPTPMPTPFLPTATLAGSWQARAGRYQNFDLGISFRYPAAWTATFDVDESTLAELTDAVNNVYLIVIHGPMPGDTSLQEMNAIMTESVAAGLSGLAVLKDAPFTLDDGRSGWVNEFTVDAGGVMLQGIIAVTSRAGRLVAVVVYGRPGDIQNVRATIDDTLGSFVLEAPRLYGLPRDQALFVLGGESTNPRDYDPAVSGGDDLVFSGLVMFNPQLETVPDLAESWDISDDGTLYTFHLRENARFHDGRPVTAGDVIYSWERAADPDTDSDTVLTYLGDIVGVKEMHDGKADFISGLKAIDDHTLQVTLDAAKPYFLMKLAYGTTFVVDRANVESGPEWYRTPNGTGPYRLIRWDRFKLQLYERNEDFYLEPPAIRYVVSQIFAGVGIRLYETDGIDLTGVSIYDAERVRDPDEPLNADLLEGVGMCTSYITFDAAQPPFDDPKVRQAFALAVDRQQYIDVALRGVSLVAHGVYPPAMPGYRLDYEGLPFDPELARQRLAESTYGSADALPPIVFTSGGFGSEVDLDVAALAQMWQTHLGVTIEIENLEPNQYSDELHDGHHGQLFSYGWCADYPDPENFADALFHSGAQQNLGNYSNPEVDALLEAARVERDVERRIQLYQDAETILVEDAAAIFLNHGLRFVLVKPHVKGYVLAPIAVPIERYLSIEPELMGK